MRILALAAAVCSLAIAGAAHANTVVVDALANSSTGGTGAVTGLTLTIGEVFNVSVALDDLWSAGALPRWANADGLIVNLFATGSDDSGFAAGTQIGAPFPTWTQDGLTAPFDSLVGRIGGVFQELGTSFSGPAWASGALTLYFWDQNNGDNSQFITADVSLPGAGGGVPEPASWALMIGGFGMMGAALRRRRQAPAAI